MIRLSKSCIGDEEKIAVQKVLDGEYLGMGAEVAHFEKELSIYFGRPAVCVATGTAALQLAVQACGIGQGDEVLVPTITYVASFQAISATGAKPVPCGVEESTLTLDPAEVERKITNRTKAIMPVHYSGGVGSLDEIYSLAESNGLRVIEDAAHAFGSKKNGQLVGSFGDIACFSFDGIKNITSGEGGCVVSSDKKLVSSISDARLLGVQKDSVKRYLGQRSWSFDVVEQGWRYHMSNVMAAIGLEQLKKSASFINRRQHLAKLYCDALAPLGKWLRTLPLDYDEVAPHIFPIELAAYFNRDAIIEKMEKNGVQTGFHYFPNHELEFYLHSEDAELEKAASIAKRMLTLPLHPDIKDEEVTHICNLLRNVLEIVIE